MIRLERVCEKICDISMLESSNFVTFELETPNFRETQEPGSIKFDFPLCYVKN